MQEIEMLPVESSIVSEIGWSKDTLRVKFPTGRVYDYHGIIQYKYDLIINAKSIGSEFKKQTKGHSYTLVNEKK